jgi:hypothetical protein
LFEDGACGDTALSRGGAFSAAEGGKRFRYAGIDTGKLVTAAQVDGAVLLDQGVDLLGCGARKDVLEQINQMKTDVAAEEVERDGLAGSGFEDLLDGTADVPGGVQQSTVDIEEINRKGRDNARPWSGKNRSAHAG